MIDNRIKLVRRAIHFNRPARVPYNFDENRTPAIETKYGDDFIWVFAEPSESFEPKRTGENEFGVIYETLDTSFGQPKVHPISTPYEIATYPLPDFSEPGRYQRLEKRIADHPDKYALGMFPHFLFQVLFDLMGFENFMLSLYEYPTSLEQLLDKLTESCLVVADQMSARGVHGIIAIEDLGVQDRLFISPQQWRQFFKPRYAAVIRRMHQNGMEFFIHSCGQIFDLIEDFIEIGVNVLQIDQQHHMGIERLAEWYGGRICFFCPADIQRVLTVSDQPEQIEQNVKSLIYHFGRYNGGFIAKTYPQPESIHIPEENNSLMCELFKRYGQYPLSFTI